MQYLFHFRESFQYNFDECEGVVNCILVEKRVGAKHKNIHKQSL